MAVLPMQKVNIYSMKKNRKAILETVQRMSVVEVVDIPLGGEPLQKVNTINSQGVFVKNVDVAIKALSVIGQYNPESKDKVSSIKGRRSITSDDYYTFSDEAEEIMHVAYELCDIDKEITEKKAHIVKCENQIESLVPWLGLDVQMRFSGTKSTAAFIGTLPGEVREEAALLEILSAAPDFSGVTIDIISSSPSQTCIFVMCELALADDVHNVLKTMGFARPPLPPKITPAQKSLELQAMVEVLRRDLSLLEQKVKSYLGFRNALRFVSDYFSMRQEKYDVISRLVHTDNIFMLQGYIAKRDAKKLQARLVENFDVYLEFFDPQSFDDVPVILKNNTFTSPVEGVLESYSLPSESEVDPTSVMSIFYYVLFGMMLSDAAYGLLMIIVCAFVLLRFRNIEDGMRKTIKMFFFCGISTVFWGVMFGSYFGDAIPVVAKTFFDKNIVIEPLWFVPIEEPMRMLAFSLFVGILHIFTGLFMKMYQCIKLGRYKDALWDVMMWYLLVGGGVVYALSMPSFSEMMKIGFVLPQAFGDVAAISALVGAVGILLTAGRASKNIFVRFLKGLYGLYGVTGYLSDILSYSRLLALGLATGVIAQVFNKMASLAGGGIVGLCMFVVIFVIGHTMNIGINLLGSYVHTNRLQFVEFLGKFYEGGGRKFSPFSSNTKYFKFGKDVL